MLSRLGFFAGVAGAAITSLPLAASTGRTLVEPDSSITVDIGEVLGTIDRNIYGHFVENLGGVVYDGIWVGPDSAIPNIDGIRTALVEAMRGIRAPVVRFPGGCFADSYDWRDGIGPAKQRPTRTSFWADSESADAPRDQHYDPNYFGTNEFMRFCALVGAQPYLAVNVRSLPPIMFDEWVEYCNAPPNSTTLARLRADAGFVSPFDVGLWGVGNEPWGCGGMFTPEQYAQEFCRYTAFVPGYGRRLSFVAAGPDKSDWEWTRRFFKAITARGPDALQSVYGFSLHDYTWNLSRGRTSDWVRGKGDAIAFGIAEWYELFRQGAAIESLIESHWRIMEEEDPEHVVKLVVDEWGSWYRPGSGPTPYDLFEQMPTLRDALYSAITLDVFNRHCDKVAMANCAQLVNCLNSLYLAHEDRFCITPVGHVFAMYAPHQGAHAVRVVVPSGLSGSASLREKNLVLTVVNPDVSQACHTRITVRGARVTAGSATTLSDKDIHAHNTFDRPDAVVPRANAVRVLGAQAAVTLAAASVTSVALTLA